MRIAFCMNLTDKGQEKICEIFYKNISGFKYIVNDYIIDDRQEINYEKIEKSGYFLFHYRQEDKEEIEKIINEYEVVVFRLDSDKYLDMRIYTKKPVLIYSDDIFKELDGYTLKEKIKKIKCINRNKNVRLIYDKPENIKNLCRLGIKKAKCFEFDFFKKYKKFETVIDYIEELNNIIYGAE